MKIALWVIGLGILAFLATGIYLAGFYPAIAPQQNGQLVFGAGTLYGRRISTESWQASYDSITASSDQSILNLEGVHDGIVDRDGRPYLNVQAQHLTVNMQTHDFVGSGKIHVAAIQNDQPLRSFECHDLAWSEALHRLTIIGPVTLESGAAEPLVVDGLTFEVKTGELHLGMIAGAANFKNDPNAPHPADQTAPPQTAPTIPANAQELPARTPAFHFYFLPAASPATAASP